MDTRGMGDPVERKSTRCTMDRGFGKHNPIELCIRYPFPFDPQDSFDHVLSTCITYRVRNW